jgi:tetratricopeptide (TPR) repeat protein
MTSRQTRIIADNIHPIHLQVSIDIQSLNKKGNEYFDQKNYEEAKKSYWNLFNTCHKIYGFKNLNTASSIYNLAIVNHKLHNYYNAEYFYLEACYFFDKLLGKHPQTANVYHDLGSLYYSSGNVDGAESYFKQALEIRRKVLREHPDTIVLMNDLASIYITRGKYNKARPLYTEAFEMSVGIFGYTHRKTAKAMLNLSTFYYNDKPDPRKSIQYIRMLLANQLQNRARAILKNKNCIIY